MLSLGSVGPGINPINMVHLVLYRYVLGKFKMLK